MNWIKRFLNKKSSSALLDNFVRELECEREKSIICSNSELEQMIEDQRIKSFINNEASRLAAEWILSPEHDFGEGPKKIFLSFPKKTVYHIHCESTAKYKGVNISDLIWDRFEEIKNTL